MSFDYSYLRGFIREKYKNNKAFAEALGIGQTSLYDRLNNKVPFTQREINTVVQKHNLGSDEIKRLFFKM